jgi:spore coat polysaccharide biosynthesis protein SpsF
MRVMEALKPVHADAFVLATDAESAPFFEEEAAEAGFSLLVGPRDDVLERYRMAIEASAADQVIRATGDNPLVSAELANLLIERGDLLPSDYAAFDGAPLGSGVELVSAAALKEAAAEANDPYEREHVCPFLYHRPERFKIDRPKAPAPFHAPDVRLTVDTPEDYRAVNAIFENIYRGAPIGLREAISQARRGMPA